MIAPRFAASRALLVVLVSSSGVAAEPTPSPVANAIDRKASACTDFYQFACGGWREQHPLPGDQPRFGRFNELADGNRAVLREILEGLAKDDPQREPLDRKVGDYYAACMDETGIEAKGLSGLKPDLDRVAALASKADLPVLLAQLHVAGVAAGFTLSSAQDFKDVTQFIADVDQGGMGLPDRDYYFRDDVKSVELRKDYVAHVQRMFELQGEAPAVAARSSAVVMEIETMLAKGAMDLVSRRDPEKVYNKMKVAELASVTPSFDWTRYLKATEAPAFTSLNVSDPGFFKGFEEVVKTRSLDDWKTYLRWQVVHGQAALLPKAFVDENFAFFGKALTGATEQRPRWKRCADAVDNDLGEALGRRYVEKAFAGQAKERMLGFVQALEKALARDIDALPWMTAATKKEAQRKLQAIVNKIGYPDIWRDYTSLEVVRTDAVGNSLRANVFDFHRRLGKVGKPVERREWGMTPPTVNAGYNPNLNDVTFPAGILRPPFFDMEADDALNLGAIGSGIGHELTHGFDDQGRQFAWDGNLKDWWTAEDAKKFEERSACLVDQYNGYTAVADVKLNGKLTLGENVADAGGVRIAYMALMDLLTGKERPMVDGFTPEQRFFLGWAQVWCENVSDESSRFLAQVDVHSPGRHRVNGVVSNLPEFAKAYSCKAGSPMVREKPCRVW